LRIAAATGFASAVAGGARFANWARRAALFCNGAMMNDDQKRTDASDETTTPSARERTFFLFLRGEPPIHPAEELETPTGAHLELKAIKSELDRLTNDFEQLRDCFARNRTHAS
jgi:hypothetical protein